MKRIGITLKDKAESYFHEVAYSLDYGDGKVPTQSQVINHCLEELSEFEKKMGMSVTDFLAEVTKNDEPDICRNCNSYGTEYCALGCTKKS